VINVSNLLAIYNFAEKLPSVAKPTIRSRQLDAWQVLSFDRLQYVRAQISGRDTRVIVFFLVLRE